MPQAPFVAFAGPVFFQPAEYCALARKMPVIYDMRVIPGNIFGGPPTPSFRRASRGLRWFAGYFSVLLVVLPVSPCAANVFDFFGGFLSSRNRERPLRPRTDYIILHTTEGPERGSLQKVIDNGETHFFVCLDGRVLKIIDKKRIAYHAGTSMWNRKTNIDNYSVGIEVQGRYDTDIRAAQYASLRKLIADLQETYGIPDDRVLTHSMVAYGKPNRWHSRPHRGRKRCGMLFAKTGVRAKLGLVRRPAYDPDVKTGRLAVGDAYLAQALYGKAPEQEKAMVRYISSTASIISKDRSAWDISRDDYDSANVLYVFPDGKKTRGNAIKDWSKIPIGTRVLAAATP